MSRIKNDKLKAWECSDLLELLELKGVLTLILRENQSMLALGEKLDPESPKRELRIYGSVVEASGNRCLYPEVGDG